MYCMEEMGRARGFSSFLIIESKLMKLNIWRFRADKRKYCFTGNTNKLWTLLLQDVVMATNLDCFKSGLDKFIQGKSISDY